MPYSVRFYVGQSKLKHERFFETESQAIDFWWEIMTAAMISKLRVIVGNVHLVEEKA